MPRTFFHDFVRDDGSPVAVEYSFGAGSETTYSPMHGACGGDACEVQIVDAWPKTARHDWWENIACWRFLARSRVRRWTGALVEWWLDVVRLRLTVAERERMEAWLAEHHVDEPDDFYEGLT